MLIESGAIDIPEETVYVKIRIHVVVGEARRGEQQGQKNISSSKEKTGIFMILLIANRLLPCLYPGETILSMTGTIGVLRRRQVQMKSR